MASAPRPGPIEFGDTVVRPGQRRSFDVPIARLPTGTWMSLPLTVLHGRQQGPSLWLSAAIHGDEVNGVEIIRHTLERLDPKQLRGTVIAAPVVNVFGVLDRNRYLPDRRDLNRSFPGSKRGSLGARLANLFMETVVRRCQYGIDFHTGTDGRENYPQIRTDLADERTRECARAFGAPLVIHARLRDGSLREASRHLGITTLIYEGGEALRFNRRAIQMGMEGTLRLMAFLEMIDAAGEPPEADQVEIARSSWVRARRGGIFRPLAELGQQVEEDTELGHISNIQGGRPTVAKAPFTAWIIGMTRKPFVTQGDALVHLGEEVD